MGDEKLEPPDYRCTCIALDHDHTDHYGKGEACPRIGTYAGGPCHECRYWHTFPERRENIA